MNKQELQDTLRNAKYANPIDIKNRISDNKFYSELIELILTKADNSQLQLLESLVHGKADAKVFETKAALDAWLLVAENKSSLIIGDIFYLREVGIPDFWWDGDTLQELESTKPDLSNLATLTQLGLKADKTQVLTNVPANAKFTDTIYTEISESEINTGTSDVARSISGRRIGYIKQIIEAQYVKNENHGTFGPYKLVHNPETNSLDIIMIS